MKQTEIATRSDKPAQARAAASLTPAQPILVEFAPAIRSGVLVATLPPASPPTTPSKTNSGGRNTMARAATTTPLHHRGNVPTLGRPLLFPATQEGGAA